MQSYVISRYLYVPRHVSANTLFSASSSQDSSPLHISLTIPRWSVSSPGIQSVFECGFVVLVQTSVDVRPYAADVIESTMPSRGHVIVSLKCSHMIMLSEKLKHRR